MWQIASPALTLAFVASMLAGMRYSGLWLRIMYRLSATWLGLLGFGFFAAFAVWIAVGINALLPAPVDPLRFVAIFFGSAVVMSLYGIVNAARLRTTRVTVVLENLPSAWQGRSAALVTDMHLGNVRGLGFTKRVVARLQRLQPEAVFISGDMFDGAVADYDALLEPWRDFAKKTAVFFVTGNHEEFGDRAKYIEAVTRAGVRVLNNEKVELRGLQVIGIHDGETHHPEIFQALLQRANLDRNRPSILLAHQPSNLAIPAEAGVSLQLSGHTHRGQVWPWHWLAARVHGRFVYGLNRWEHLQVFTSSGAGTWGPPMRVNTRSEIVLIRFEAQKN
jgi:predicted MPP superfamily phosphohydrolase